MAALFFDAFAVSLEVGAFKGILEVDLLVGVLGMIVLDAVEIHQVLYQLVIDF